MRRRTSGRRKRPTSSSQLSVTSFRAALRSVMELVPTARAVSGAGLALERMTGDAEVPHLIDAEVVEDATLRSRAVPGAPVEGFAAFLDGVQESHVLVWCAAAPVVYGVVSAVVRERITRRLVTWRAPIVERRVYAPFPYVPRELLGRHFDASILTDTAHADAAGAVPPPHPILLLDRAKTAVSRDREQAERRLAEQWCAEEDRPLLVDGGIGGSDAASASPWVVGVVKTHRTLYAEGGALDTVLALEAGQRSSVFRIAGGEQRRAVLSFYLRQRAVGGQDALWGLIRVEMAHTHQVTARADEISRWLLAERAPLAMPDARWDKMTYGVRNAEEMLRAIR